MSLKIPVLNIACVLIGVLIALVLLELLLRIDDRRPNLNDFVQKFTLNGVSYSLIESKEAIERNQEAILIVGDSFTRGTACGNRQNYPSAFTRAAKRADINIHAVNLGIDGAGPISYLRAVKDYIAEHGPPLGLIITLYANDTRMNCWECEHLEGILGAVNFPEKDTATQHNLCGVCMPAIMPGHRDVARVNLARRSHMWLVGKSKVYRLLREFVVRFAVNNDLLKTSWGRLSLPSEWTALDGVRFRLLEAVLKQVKITADDFDVPMMIVIYPDVSNLTEGSVYAAIYRKTSRHLSKVVGVQTHTGFDAFLGNADAKKDMSFSLTDAHPSCKAHAIFGEWVFNKWVNRSIR